MDKYGKIFSLRNKLITFIMCVIIIPNLIIVYYTNFTFSKHLQEIFNKETTEKVSLVDDKASMYIEKLKEDVRFLADTPLVKNSEQITTSEKSEQQIYELYSNFGQKHSRIKYIYMGTEQGSFVKWPKSQVESEYDPRTRPWYKDAINHKGEVVITDPYYAINSKENVISIVKTITNDINEIIGVQAIDISLNEISNMIKYTTIGETGYLIVLDKNGIIIGHSNNPRMNFKDVKELKIERLDNIKEIQSDDFETDLNGMKKLVNIYTSPKTGLKFVTIIDKEEVVRKSDMVKKILSIMVEVCILITTIVGVAFANKFLKPIVIIKDHLNYIGLGELSKKVPESIIKRNDEIGELSIALQAMQNKLKNLIVEIRYSESNVLRAKEEMKENLNFLETLMNTIPSPIFAKDKNGYYNHCNKAFSDFIGISMERIIDHTVYEIFDEQFANIYYDADNELEKQKGKQIYETKVMDNDNEEHDVIFKKAAILNNNEDFNGIVGVILDVTEERKKENKINRLLKVKEAMLQLSYSANEMLSIKDMLQLALDKVIECVDEKSVGSVLLLDNDNMLTMIVANGYDDKEIGKFSFVLEESFVWKASNRNIDETVVINNLEELKNINILKTKTGDSIKSIISGPIVVNNKLYGFINLDSICPNVFGKMEIELMDYIRYQVAMVINKHILNEQIMHLSLYDKLTSLYNRNYFEHLIHTDINKCIQDNTEFFVVVFDLNGLKFVNDNYGHLIGDKFIKIFAEGLIKHSRLSDILARFGGDEFVGVYFDTNLEFLINNFKKLDSYFEDNPIIYEGKKIKCSYSYGISNFPQDGNDFNELIKNADKKMYEYKKILKAKIKENEKNL